LRRSARDIDPDCQKGVNCPPAIQIHRGTAVGS
jgi:hypothetical protein